MAHSSAPRKRRGFTLAELCVVMAIVGIIGTCTVSFCILINAHVGRINRERDIQDNLDLISTALDRWYGRFDSQDYDLSILVGGGTLAAVPIATEPEDPAIPDAAQAAPRFLLGFNETDRTLSGQLDDGNTLQFPLPAIAKMQFRIRRDPGAAGCLLICTVTYEQIASATGMTIQKNIEFYHNIRAAQ